MNKLRQLKRYTILIISLFAIGFSFNTFLLPNNVVTGGIVGLSILTKDFIRPSTISFIVNAGLLITSALVIGLPKTKDYILGALLLPLFIELTGTLSQYIDVTDAGLLIQIIFAATITGTAIGYIIKNDFSIGSTGLLAIIMSYILKLPVGKIIRIVDGLIIIAGTIAFGPINAMYAIVYIYILTLVIDKIIIGISNSKSFYIITDQEEPIKNYIIETLGHGASIIKATGGFKNDNKNMIFCVIPTISYFKLKEQIKKIDKKAFFIITDSYEVNGGA